jgi:hypothetical protein
VVNQITKRGSNDFTAGGNVLLGAGRPARRTSRTSYYANPLVPSDIGASLQENNSQDSADAWNANLWAGGALIKDRLFAYGLVLVFAQRDHQPSATSTRSPTTTAR